MDPTPTPAETPAPAEDGPYQKKILAALQSKTLYAGTVPAKVKDQRRATGKVARAARRQTRRGR